MASPGSSSHRPGAGPGGRGRPRAGSTFWRSVFMLGYVLVRAADPVVRWILRVAPGLLPRTVELRVPGRRSGRDRRTLLTLLAVDSTRYIGHPNGVAAWALNAVASPEAEIVHVDGSRRRVRPVRLEDGPEREAVIRATWSQQPFPVNLLYRAASSHIRAVGVYFRLAEPASGAAPV